ncbi:addiction module toxin RelE [Duganella sp. FT135W]|uniref:Addiction module toxin RelE n=1 Tax=Duganella flavida TaxID=2692175 RepID=A0A6L8KH96_9BURK|nr:transposase [Duganella flavida]MYM23871.1 addiction module toxin RelE [Duganella flavida]
MTRPLRIEYKGALYHVTARGDRQDSIYRSDSDRLVWLSLLGDTCTRFNFAVHAYCQMTNHYHLLLETLNGRLSLGMRYLNGNYSQYFNRQHDLVGHVYQGRYKAILCQHESYLQELSRYIELNPVRAGITSMPEKWPWSSYRATIGLEDAQAWLQLDLVLAQFGSNRREAQHAYREFTLAGIKGASPLRAVRNQLLLGDEAFCQQVIGKNVPGDLSEIKRNQRSAIILPLAEYFVRYRSPKEAMACAYLSMAYSMPEIARFARVSVKTVSRAVKTFVKEQRMP